MKRKRILAPCGIFLTLCAFLLPPSAFAIGPPHGRAAAKLDKAQAPPAFDLDGAQQKRIEWQERQQQDRRLTAYRAYFYRKHGYYPTQPQFREWYYRAYGVHPT